LLRGLDRSPPRLYVGVMAKVDYSTHYANPYNTAVWSWRIAGLFQIKDDEVPAPSAQYTSPSFSYTRGYDPDFGDLESYLIDYDVARYWPHP
jgi:hypothetical protein